MRITKAIREEAAMLCAAIASFVSKPDDNEGPFFIVAESLEASDSARKLTLQAQSFVWQNLCLHLPDYGAAFVAPGCVTCGSLPRRCGSLYYAEAEALLRTGWTPTSSRGSK